MQRHLIFVFGASLALAGCSGATPVRQEGSGITVQISPNNVSLAQQATQVFTCTVTGSTDGTCHFFVAETGGGSVTADGLYTAPRTGGTFHVIASSAKDGNATDTAAVTVAAGSGIGVQISPGNVSLAQRATQVFTCTVTGGTDSSCGFSVTEPGGGSISADGIYTAPRTGGTFHVVASSAQDGTATGTATVTVAASSGITVQINPRTAKVTKGNAATFACAVAGSTNLECKFSVTEAAAGTITSSGVFTASTTATAGTYHVVATSVDDPTATATALVTIPAGSGITVQLSPKNVSVAQLTSTTFACAITGSANQGCSFSVTEAAGGTITGAGVYVAPAIAGTYHVVAASAADPTATDAAAVVVRPVAPCPTGSGATGVWENISPTAFVGSNMESLSVVVDDVNQIVYAAAGNITNGCGGSGPACKGTGVYASADCGSTWLHASTGQHSADLATGDPWAMLIDPVQPATLYINNGYGSPATLFKSTNAGIDWAPLAPDSANTLASHHEFVQAIAMEPGNSQHIAVTFHDNCTSPWSPLCLSQSTDGGATWHVFNGPSQAQGWEEAASLTILGADAYFLTCSDGAFYTADGGANWELAIPHGILGSYGGGAHGAPDGTLYVGVTNQGIYASHATATTAVGQVWAQVPGSPNASVITDDGVNLLATYAWDTGGQPFYSATLGNVTSWQNLQSPSIVRGANMFAYDSAHHIVYAANWATGLWRMTSR